MPARWRMASASLTERADENWAGAARSPHPQVDRDLDRVVARRARTGIGAPCGAVKGKGAVCRLPSLRPEAATAELEHPEAEEVVHRHMRRAGAAVQHLGAAAGRAHEDLAELRG